MNFNIKFQKMSKFVTLISLGSEVVLNKILEQCVSSHQLQLNSMRGF